MSVKKERISYRSKILLLVFLDVLSVIVAYSFGLWARFDFKFTSIAARHYESLVRFEICVTAVTIASYYAFRLYHSVWRFAGMQDLYRILSAYAVIGVFDLLATFIKPIRIPRGGLLLGYVLNLVFCLGLRFGYRILRNLLRNNRAKTSNGERVLIVGAGQAAQEIIKDIRSGHSDEYEIVALVDDNAMKQSRYLEGIRVEGNRNDIIRLVKEKNIDRIIFAITNIDPQNRKEILNICKEADCELMTVPGLYQIYSGEISVSKLKHVEIEDLLGRNEIRVDLDQILNGMRGKCVMVTGGGGSIGSELCRQIAKAEPSCLIIFDIYENSTYDIQQELKRICPDLNVLALIGDVTDRARMHSVFSTYHPEMVFHAAAHKHVPLMETNPEEAVKNNVIGTFNVANLADLYRVKKFVLVSTDKAVNPTNVMGATKRCCEMIMQYMAEQSTGTEYVAVRFGNVLGSNGSVIPLFKKQIEEGGPVTVTDPDIIRYFMTIPEAVSLILQAGAMAHGGEIFVLDMGEPVKIVTLAENLIRQYGKEPYRDIPIVFTGLRPGEKLFEELLMNEEGLQSTMNNKIFIGNQIPVDIDDFIRKMRALKEVMNDEDVAVIIRRLYDLVPTFQHRELHLESEAKGDEGAAETPAEKEEASPAE